MNVFLTVSIRVMTDVQVLIIVIRRLREIEFVDSEDTHSMELVIRKKI